MLLKESIVSDHHKGSQKQDWLLWPAICLGVIGIILYFVFSEGLKLFGE